MSDLQLGAAGGLLELRRESDGGVRLAGRFPYGSAAIPQAAMSCHFCLTGAAGSAEAPPEAVAGAWIALRARQTCFCGLFGSATIACNR